MTGAALFSSPTQLAGAAWNPFPDISVRAFLLDENPEIDHPVGVGVVFKNRSNETLLNVTFQYTVDPDDFEMHSSPAGELTEEIQLWNITETFEHEATNGDLFDISAAFLNSTYMNITVEAITNTTTFEFDFHIIPFASGDFSIDTIAYQFNDYWGDFYPSEDEFRHVSPIPLKIPAEVDDPRTSWLPDYNGTISEVLGMEIDYVYVAAVLIGLPIIVIAICFLSRHLRLKRKR